MRTIIRKILKEELLLEDKGSFTQELAIELWENVLSYPQSRTKKTYDF